MNLRKVLVSLIFIGIILSLPLAVAAQNGKGKGGPPEVIPGQVEKDLPEQAQNGLEKKITNSVDKVKKSVKVDKGEPPVKKGNGQPFDQVPDHAKAEQSLKVKVKQPDIESKVVSGPPEHAKANKAKPEVTVKPEPQPSKVKKQQENKTMIPDQAQPENLHKEGTPSSITQKEPDHQQVIRKEAKRMEQTEEKPSNSEPQGHPAPQPLEDGAILSMTSLQTVGKTVKDRSTNDSHASVVIGHLSDREVSHELHARMIPPRTHLLRNQWMNAPPGKPPKFSL